MMINFFLYFINIVIILFLPFLFLGIINKVKAFWGGRKGASVWQPLFDTLKLLQKKQVISTATSFVFIISPLIIFGCVIVAMLITPLTGQLSFLSFKYDFVIFAYFLALARFFMIIMALDTGSSFEAMGASREALLGVFVEPAFILIFASLAMVTDYTSFAEILATVTKISDNNSLFMILAIILLGTMLLVEGCRVPVDDPNTHLELTMIHEVMILDNSGINLALLSYSSSLKMILISSLMVNIFISHNFTLLVSIGIYVLIMLFIAICIGFIESIVARFKMSTLPQFVFLMTAVSILAMSSILFIKS